MWHRLWEHHGHHHHHNRCSPVMPQCPPSCYENAVEASRRITHKTTTNVNTDEGGNNKCYQQPLHEWEEQVMRNGTKVGFYTFNSPPCDPLEQEHLRLIETAFKQHISDKDRSCYHITSVQYLLNPRLMREFDERRKEAGGDMIMAFHGTREANIKSIARDNFKIDRCKSATPLGRAVWFSTDPLQALLYVPPDKHSTSKKLVVAKILTGDSYKGICTHACDECIHGSHTHKMYDTVIDGHVVMVMEQGLILPCYVITVEEVM
jgi:hypothetical protein